MSGFKDTSLYKRKNVIKKKKKKDEGRPDKVISGF